MEGETVLQIAERQEKKQSLYFGLSKGMPIFIGYLPIGFAYGILAIQSNFTVFETGLMSLLVYAGASQFIAVGMIASSAEIATIVLTTFLVNLRHMLMSASLAQQLQGQSKKRLAAFSFLVTDESFAVNSTLLKKDPTTPFISLFAVNVIAYIGWFIGGIAGAIIGSQAIDVEKYGLDYALPAMFIILLIFQLENRKSFVLAFLAGVMSLVLSQFMTHNLHIIIATVVAATLGVVISRWKMKTL